MRMKYFFPFLMTAIILQMLGCATKPIHPGWIDGEDAIYKKSQYLTGRGQGASFEQAKDRARADLAEIFQVNVSVENSDVQQLKSSTLNGKVSNERLISETSRSINTNTEQMIRGMQIAEIWTDPLTSTTYALAILPRAQTETSLRQQIKLLDDAIQSSVDQLEKINETLAKVAAFSKIRDLQIERENLQKALQVVDLSGQGMESKHNSSKFRLEIDALLKSIRMSAKILEGSIQGLDEVVNGAIAKAGYTVNSVGLPQYMLKASLKLTDMGKIDGWYWQRGNLEISISEAATGRVWGAMRWPIKASARDKDSAIKRGLDDADQVLKSELGSAILGMANVK